MSPPVNGDSYIRDSGAFWRIPDIGVSGTPTKDQHAVQVCHDLFFLWWGFMVAAGSFWFPGLGQVAQMILGKAAFLEAGRTASIAVLSRHAHAH